MAAFGTEFMPKMTLARYVQGHWGELEWVASDALPLHPAAHVLHYASTCFEGLKAFKHEDGSVHIFRMERNVARMQQSSKRLFLPPIPTALLERLIVDAVRAYEAEVPAPPGSLYIRPTHIGTEPSIGKAAGATNASLLYVLLSPVGNYFAAGAKALRLYIETDAMRCAPHMGMVKGGGNYASALQPIQAARAAHQADQVLFAPGGDVQETGAANFILIDGNDIITKDLDSTFLHGVTRDAILTLARDMGMNVQERALSVEELLTRARKPHTEAALSGTAAVLAPVGELVYQDQLIRVGSGEPGPTTLKLRQALNDIQWGHSKDKHGWLTRVSA